MKRCEVLIDSIQQKLNTARQYRVNAQSNIDRADQLDVQSKAEIEKLADDIRQGKDTTGNSVADWCICKYGIVWDSFIAMVHGVQKRMQEHDGELILIVEAHYATKDKKIIRETLRMGIIDEGWFRVDDPETMRFPVSKWVAATDYRTKYNEYSGSGGGSLEAGDFYYNRVDFRRLNQLIDGLKRPGTDNPYYGLEILIGNQEVTDWIVKQAKATGHGLSYGEAFERMAQMLEVDVRLSLIASAEEVV